MFVCFLQQTLRIFSLVTTDVHYCTCKFFHCVTRTCFVGHTAYPLPINTSHYVFTKRLFTTSPVCKHTPIYILTQYSLCAIYGLNIPPEFTHPSYHYPSPQSFGTRTGFETGSRYSSTNLLSFQLRCPTSRSPSPWSGPGSDDA